jgi:hypothetical protein
MQIALLDVSGSMGQAFEGEAGFDGLVEPTRHAVKLDAAKEALLAHMAGLGRPDRIAVIAFSTHTNTIYDGSTSDRAALSHSLNSLRAGGGTDIARALGEAQRVAQGAEAALIRVMVVTDGLADEKEAEEAARRFVVGTAFPVIIDVILIDPTSAGEAVCRGIALNGGVKAVTSTAQLSVELRSTGASRAAQAAQVRAMLAAAEADRQEALAARGDHEVAFTGAWTRTITDSTWSSMLVFVHRADAADEVRRRIERRSTLERRPFEPTPGSGRPRVELGTRLMVRPVAGDLEFNPPFAELAYLEAVQEVDFRFRRSAKRQSLGNVASFRVEISVCVDGDPVVGVIAGTVELASFASSATRTAMTTMVDSVFASYSREDEAIVLRCAAAYKALGIVVYRDIEAVRSGEAWWIAIQSLIAKADLFQLFWSEGARRSEWVEREWRHALGLVPMKDLRFIRPVYWAYACPEPPPDLKDVNFARLDLGEDVRRSLRVMSTGTRTRAASPACVVPLLPGVAERDVRALEGIVGEAVARVRELTGLAYDPVPTLLVDEHVVRSVRERLVPDPSPSNPNEDRARAVAHALGVFCLELGESSFTRVLCPGVPFAQLLQDRLGIPDASSASLIRALCEWVVPAAAREIFSPDESNHSASSGFAQLADLGYEALRPSLAMPRRLAGFLAIIDGVLERLTEIGGEVEHTFYYKAKSEVWKEVSDLFVDTGIVVSATTADEKYSVFTGTVAAHARGFRALRIAWDQAFAPRPNDTVVAELSYRDLPTNGIFLSVRAADAERQLSRWAAEHDVPVRFTLPGRDRVLFCAAAIARWCDQLADISADPEEAAERARRLARAIMVHEHLHAALSVTPGDDGLPTAIAQRVADDGADMEEAVAAWAQLVDLRDDPLLLSVNIRWAEHGSWPDWPYAGYRRVAELHADVDDVRGLIRDLRANPAAASRAFRQRTERSSPT